MEDWQYIESKFESLDQQLEVAKKHIFKVPVDFETRFRIWRDQVIPDRLRQLEKHLSLETAVRFYGLTYKDVVRLYKRATKEFLEIADERETSRLQLEFFQKLYLTRQDLLYTVHEGYVNDMKVLIETVR